MLAVVPHHWALVLGPEFGGSAQRQSWAGKVSAILDSTRQVFIHPIDSMAGIKRQADDSAPAAKKQKLGGTDKPANKASDKAPYKASPKSGSKPYSKPGSKPYSKSGSKPYSKPGFKPGSKPGANSAQNRPQAAGRLSPAFSSADILATSSKDAHLKQKQLARERKAAKPNADSIQRSKQLWEQLRRKSHVEKEERSKLVDELFALITGNVHDFVFKHDSVRVVQCALKYAKEEQRLSIAKELKGEFKTLAQSKYGKFLVAKLLVTGNAHIRDLVVSEFSGHVRHLINHPEASWILDDTYRQVATTKQKATLLREWYGPEFSIYKTAAESSKSSDLATILAANPEKRKQVVDYLKQMINQLIQKKMTGFTMLHDAMLQYSLAIGTPKDSEAAAEFLELLKEDEESDLLKNLAFTASGARVVSRAIALSNAKGRKNILRVYKSHVQDLAQDANGSLVLLAAYEAVDDTVMLSQLIISEMIGSKLGTLDERIDLIAREATDLVARTSLLWPLTIGNSKWLVKPGSALAHGIDEVQQLRGETSKKDPEARRKELTKALSEDGAILSTVETHCAELVESSFGCQFITEAILGCTGDNVAAMTAVAGLVVGDPTSDDHIAKSSHVGRMLRTLALGGKFDAGAGDVVSNTDERLGFAEMLYAVIKDYAVEWAVGGNSFIIANYLDDKGFAAKEELEGKLKSRKTQIEASAKEGNKGAELVLQRL